jgi:hypothetical protein
MPPQSSYSPPNNAYAPLGKSTSTYTGTPATYTRPTTLNPGSSERRPSFEHPPGYLQNPYAANLSEEKKQMSREQEAQGGLFGGRLDADPMEDGGVWGAVKGWVAGAGSKLAETEAEVWKRINGEK